MHVDITFRHMEATEALKEHAEEKAQSLERFFRSPMTARWVLDVRHGTHCAELILSGGGEKYVAEDKGDSMYHSIDMAHQRVAKQVRRNHEKRNDHHPQHGELGAPTEVV